ncbi:MAG: hypothetical protein KGN32_10955 [Burkholderiales bacterium]|nr:hypothetical protein [Burkholderiales bacterium]
MLIKEPANTVAIEKAGKLDRKAVAQAMKGLEIKVAMSPCILMDVKFDDRGDLDHESYHVEVRNGRPMVTEVLPPLGKK